ncbi:hypothetical protein GGI24_003744 [Coemansia furcata]|nr:hypothetical protein GGI24_003744 [Coemansia furcata]
MYTNKRKYSDTKPYIAKGVCKRESIMKNFYSYQFKLESDGRTRIPDDNGNEWSILQHEKFLRGRPDLLRDIKRAPVPPHRR